MFPIAYEGAPGVAIEKLPSGSEIGTAIQALERFTGVRAAALMMAEVGGHNALMPVAEAAARGLPLVDADSMRRAFPRLEMTLLTPAGISAAPAAIADEHGNVVVVEAVDNHMMETVGRAVVTTLGGFGGIATYLLTARQVIEHAVLGSVSYCGGRSVAAWGAYSAVTQTWTSSSA